MNVYAILEDGEVRVFGAPNMAAAVEAAWADALRDETERAGRPLTDEEATNERKLWERDVLESVTLVGELVNFDDLRASRWPAMPEDCRAAVLDALEAALHEHAFDDAKLALMRKAAELIGGATT